jgi:hypothetical protein
MLHISQAGLEHYLAARDPLKPQRNYLWTVDSRVELPIQVAHTGYAALPPTTLTREFTRVARENPEAPALSVKVDGRWVTTNYAQYYQQALMFAKALLFAGVKPFMAVNINGFNSP